MELTPRQRAVLDFIRKHQARWGIAPSIREIGAHLGLKSPGGVHRILKVLEQKGYLTSLPGKKRSWQVRGGLQLSTIPLLGKIAAGLPIQAQESWEEELPVDPALFGVSECFGLRVQGDSMIDAHITDGDLAIIRPQEDAEDGEIVAVMVEGILPEATLKILKRKSNAIELHAANPRYSPLIFWGKDRAKVKVIGRLVGIIRRK